jgi:two-component system cell cycle sensor histidine kinase/response regulator CckA
VMNLVINGAEAIGPDGGMVTVRTGIQFVEKGEIETMSPGEMLPAGEYVGLEVQDTGCGMPQETIAKIFDPFFTTKFAGRGLGLSAVQGIVRAHRGALKVVSTPVAGTTFRVLLPVSTQPITGPRRMASSESLAGTGTVLIADDEEIVREIARQTLERYGYLTVTAGDGARAVEEFRQRPDLISLVLLDLTMPVKSGEQALREMQEINPRVRVLLTSGYNEVEAVQRFAGKGLAGFIQKPFTAVALAEKVKEVLTP